MNNNKANIKFIFTKTTVNAPNTIKSIRIVIIKPVKKNLNLLESLNNRDVKSPIDNFSKEIKSLQIILNILEYTVQPILGYSVQPILEYTVQ